MNPNAEQVRQMSDDELRVKIAEALGWKRVVLGQVYAYTPTGSMDDVRGSLPDWPRDLNAAAELTQHAQSKGAGFEVCDVQHNTGVSWWDYECIIYDPVGPACRQYKATGATEPRARSEAWYLWWLEVHK